MARIIRRVVANKKRGAALIAALQIITLILIGFFSFFGGSQQSPKAPAETQVTGPVASGAAAGNQTARPQTAAEKAALRKSAHFGKKLYEPLASEIYNLATTNAAAVTAARNEARNLNQPYNGATLTTDRQDYPPFSYVYFHGTGFQPGETVD